MSGEAHLEALLDVIVMSARKAISEYKKGGNEVPTIHSKTYHPIDFATDAVALWKAVNVLEGACQQLCASLVPPRYTIVKSAVPYDWACVKVVVGAKVADALEKYPSGLHVDKLSKLVNLEKGKLARVLRYLSSKGCFTEVLPDTFSNNRISFVTLSSSNIGSFSRLLVEDTSEGALVLHEMMADPEYATSYHPEKAPLIYALRKKGFKGNYFEFLKQDTDKRENFHRAMVGISTSALSVVHHYPWNDVKTVCDVGAGIGAISRPLSKIHSHLKITHQDTPEVLVQARSVWAEDAADALHHKRVEFVPLNFFEESPVLGQDVYYLRQIIHDWPDIEATTILRNVRKAMATHSRLLIHETVLPPRSHDPNILSFGLDDVPEVLLPGIGNRAFGQDMAMWLVHNSRERTVDEYTALASAAGLELEKVYDLANSAVLEFKMKS